MEYKVKCKFCNNKASVEALNGYHAQKLIVKRYGWGKLSMYGMFCPEHLGILRQLKGEKWETT